MPRRPFCQMASAFLLGAALAAYTAYALYVKYAMLAAVLVALTAGQWVFCQRHGADRIRCILGCLLTALALLFGWRRCMEENVFRESYRALLEEGARLSVQGQLIKKEIKNDQYVYHLSSCYIRREGGQDAGREPVPCHSILAYSDADVASVGEILVLDGTVELWRSAVNEGNFDEKTFYEARGICTRLRDIQLKAVYGKADQWKEALYRLRMRMEETYLSVMGTQAGGVMSTVALGDKSVLDAEVKQLYQVCGISHILAISGVKMLYLVSPYPLKKPVNWAFMRLHIAGSYIIFEGFSRRISPHCPSWDRGDKSLENNLAKVSIISQKQIKFRKSYTVQQKKNNRMTHK